MQLQVNEPPPLFISFVVSLIISHVYNVHEHYFFLRLTRTRNLESRFQQKFFIRDTD
jgi:hypothetical protein